MANLKLPIKKGTKTAFGAISTKDANTIYILTDANDENNIFLGSIPLGKGNSAKTIKDVSFNSTTQAFTFTYTDNTTSVVDLVLESVIQSVSYSSTTKKLTFTLVSGSTTQVDLADLVDAYTGGTSNSVVVSVTGGVVTADVRLSNTANNGLSIETGKGLYINISGKVDKVTTAVSGNITAFGASGALADSGKTFTTTVTDAAVDTKIPTEKAVADALVIGTF
jgi:hypothetical protein